MRDRPRREHPDARPEVSRAPVAHPPDVASVLRLQALVGNAATSRLLAREPKAPEQERTIAVEGMGTAAVVSFSLAGEHGFDVTLEDGPLSPKLHQAFTRGDPIPSVTIGAAGHTYTLSDVSVASFQIGGTPPAIAVEFQGSSLHVR